MAGSRQDFSVEDLSTAELFGVAVKFRDLDDDRVSFFSEKIGRVDGLSRAEALDLIAKKLEKLSEEGYLRLLPENLQRLQKANADDPETWEMAVKLLKGETLPSEQEIEGNVNYSLSEQVAEKERHDELEAERAAGKLAQVKPDEVKRFIQALKEGGLQGQQVEQLAQFFEAADQERSVASIKEPPAAAPTRKVGEVPVTISSKEPQRQASEPRLGEKKEPSEAPVKNKAYEETMKRIEEKVGREGKGARDYFKSPQVAGADFVNKVFSDFVNTGQLPPGAVEELSTSLSTLEASQVAERTSVSRTAEPLPSAAPSEQSISTTSLPGSAVSEQVGAAAQLGSQAAQGAVKTSAQAVSGGSVAIKARDTINTAAGAAGSLAREAANLLGSSEVRSTAAEGASRGQIWLRKGVDFVRSPLGFGVAAGTLAGAFLTPGAPLLGAAGGGIMGSALGLGLQNSPLAGGGGRRRGGGPLGTLANAANRFGQARSMLGLARGAMALVGGSGAGSLAAVVIIVFIILFVVFLFIMMTTSGAFVDFGQGDHIDQEVKVEFHISKSAVDSGGQPKLSYPDFTTGPQVINYVVRIAGFENTTITQIQDKMVRYGASDPDQGTQIFEKSLLPGGQQLTVSGGRTETISDSFTATGAEFKDSTLVNIVTVTAQVEGGTKTDTAVEIVTLGNPPSDQPYGYPAVGIVKSIDSAIIRGASGSYYAHGGSYLFGKDLNGSGDDRSLVQGGLDVSSGDAVEVKSTLDGFVKQVGFDQGNGKLTNSKGENCPNTGNGFTCLALGGYVYVQDASKKYAVAYLHLDRDIKVKAGDKVTRGQVLGTTYPDKLPTSTGRHVHYQVLIAGSNWPFANSFGACTEGKLLPTQPVFNKTVVPSEVAPQCGPLP